MFIPIASRRKVRVCAIGCGAVAAFAAVFAMVRNRSHRRKRG